jgi:hypothetical protein
MKSLIISTSLVIFWGCSLSNQGLVEKFDQVDFDFFKGTTVYYRSKGPAFFNTSVLFIHRNDKNCGPYVVTIRNWNKKIIDISDHLLIDQNCYLDESKIEMIFHKFLKLNVGLLKVDTVGNVSINPLQGAEPTLLRITPKFDETKLKGYKLIRDNWYIKE